jgi:hypothetical protein
MAGRRKRSESAPALDLSTLDVQDVTEPVQWRESTAEPSPLQEQFDGSASALQNGATEGTPKQVFVNTEDEAKQVVQQVRRAAGFRNLGSKVKTEPTNDGRIRVVFAAKSRKAPRRYSQDDLRNWANTPEGAQVLYDNGVEAPPDKGRVSGTVAKLYREAHGL